MLGLHPTSAEYYPLTADSLEHKSHELSFFGGRSRRAADRPIPDRAEPLDLLRRLGYAGEEVPDLLTTDLPRAARGRSTVRSSTTSRCRRLRPIRAYAGGRNYIEWLVDAAADSITAVQAEQGFDGGKPPKALLYLLLRHALQLELPRDRRSVCSLGRCEPSDAVALRREPPFVHVDADDAASTARAATPSCSADERVTGDDRLTIGDYIARHVRTARASRAARAPRRARPAGHAADRTAGAAVRRAHRHRELPPRRVEDRPHRAGRSTSCAAARRQVPHARMELVPRRWSGGPAGGVYLGAYGWVEDLRPEGKEPHAGDARRRPRRGRRQARTPSRCMKDPTNLGLVHAPSINHAATAAVLRNAHVAHSGAMSVDLSSRRVRLALAVLEGMRDGQSLGALLGYQLERHLHDNGPLTVRALVYPLRRAYPLAANQIQATATTDGDAQESIAAMNVVDGRKLARTTSSRVRRRRLPVRQRRPAAPRRRPRRTPSPRRSRHIRDINDAVADLVVAEGVHQAVLGNYDRSAGTLEAFAKGNHPPEPERDPHAAAAARAHPPYRDPPADRRPGNPVPAIPMTPLATAEPALNRWLAGRLPAPADVVGCTSTTATAPPATTRPSRSPRTTSACTRPTCSTAPRPTPTRR